MMHLLERLFDATQAIHGAQGKSDLKLAIADGFLAFGFRSYNLGCHKTDKYALALDPTFATWSDEFKQEYERRNWGDNDPNLARAAMTDRPFCWSIHDRHESPLEQSYFDYLCSTPLKGGILVPLPRQPGRLSSVSVESFTDSSFSDDTVFGVAMVASAAFTRAEILGLCDAISADQAAACSMLTERQMEILKWAAAGKSNTDIATIMNLPRRTIEYHLSKTFQKLGVSTRSQAIAVFAAMRR